MEGSVFFRDRDVAIETLWWMMTQNERFKVDRVELFEELEDGYAYINYRYFRDNDDYEVQNFAKSIKASKEKEWDSVDPDAQNLDMLDVIRTQIQIERVFQMGCLDPEVKDVIWMLLDARVADICGCPPGPSVKLVELFTELERGESNGEND